MKINKNNCSGFCIPFVIYVSLSLINIIQLLIKPVHIEAQNPTNTRLYIILVNTFIHVLFGSLIYWLCSKCNNVLAWVILLFPIIFSVIFMVILMINMGFFIQKN